MYFSSKTKSSEQLQLNFVATKILALLTILKIETQIDEIVLPLSRYHSLGSYLKVGFFLEDSTNMLSSLERKKDM